MNRKFFISMVCAGFFAGALRAEPVGISLRRSLWAQAVERAFDDLALPFQTFFAPKGSNLEKDPSRFRRDAIKQVIHLYTGEVSYQILSNEVYVVETGLDESNHLYVRVVARAGLRTQEGGPLFKEKGDYVEQIRIEFNLVADLTTGGIQIQKRSLGFGRQMERTDLIQRAVSLNDILLAASDLFRRGWIAQRGPLAEGSSEPSPTQVALLGVKTKTDDLKIRLAVVGTDGDEVEPSESANSIRVTGTAKWKVKAGIFGGSPISVTPDSSPSGSPCPGAIEDLAL